MFIAYNVRSFDPFNLDGGEDEDEDEDKYEDMDEDGNTQTGRQKELGKEASCSCHSPEFQSCAQACTLPQLHCIQNPTNQPNKAHDPLNTTPKQTVKC